MPDSLSPGQLLFDHAHREWVVPEIARRQANNSLPEGFTIFSCLIRLPTTGSPIVEFNGEISWQTKVKLVNGTELMAEGEAVTLSQVETIEEVSQPKVDDVAVPFLFIGKTGDGWKIVYDPTGEPVKAGEPWKYSKTVGEYLTLVLREKVIHYHDANRNLERVALWPAPALMPNPLAKIVELCQQDEFENARALLVSHCSPSFLRNLVDSWVSVESFRIRASLLNDAMYAHENQRYSLSVSALIPQIEGITTDWMYEQSLLSAPSTKQKVKIEKFSTAIKSATYRTYSDRRVAELVADFITSVVFHSFYDWLSPVSVSFPGRHPIGHGKFEPQLYTEENSIKVFLLLDTLHNVLQRAANM